MEGLTLDATAVVVGIGFTTWLNVGDRADCKKFVVPLYWAVMECVPGEEYVPVEIAQVAWPELLTVTAVQMAVTPS